MLLLGLPRTRRAAVLLGAALAACTSQPTYLTRAVDCQRIPTINAEIAQRETLGFGIGAAGVGSVGLALLHPVAALPVIATTAMVGFAAPVSTADLREERAYLAAACRGTEVAARTDVQAF